MRTALVRVPDDAPDPDGLIGYYSLRCPRRYAVVTDLTAWTAWAKETAPDMVADCGHVDRSFESHVRKWYAAHGTWPGPNGDTIPDGLAIRQDSASRIHCVTPSGQTWESPLDVTPEDVRA